MIKMSTAGDILASILGSDKDCVVLLHNTRNIETAKLIMEEGFQFEEQLTYSCDRVIPGDIVEINYFLVERKEYGLYTVVIEIEKKLFSKYNYLADTSDINFEDLITVKDPVLSDNDEYIYTLAPQYIKGFLDNTSGEFHNNKQFNPKWESPVYLDNYKRLKGEA